MRLKPSAILLVGPTGAGKTPLGEWLHAHGLWGRTVRHFDFGEQLRTIVAAEEPPPFLTPDECAYLDQVLNDGALLENEHFPIAKKILNAFICRGLPDKNTLIALNGLPRHVGQAEDVATLVEIRTVIALSCCEATAAERLRTNAGGDRTARTDDDADAVSRKLKIYAERTAPLLDYYRTRGIRILTVPVTPSTSPKDIVDQLKDAPSC